MKNNKVSITCSFCKASFVLDWNEREHICTCGVRYIYRPNTGHAPGRGYAQRNPNKVIN